MVSNRVRPFIVFLIVMCMAAGMARAQSDTSPIIILNDGDLWEWDIAGGMKQMTFWGYNQEPVMSPDGKQVAYMAWSPITVEAIEREGGIAGGEVPGDIKILDVASQQETVIAAQPPEASFFTQGAADKAVIRSKPTWSPDGSRLAWTEYDIPGDGLNRVMVYDFASATIQPVMNDLPPQAGVPVPMDITWGKSGLILRSTIMNAANPAGFEDSFLVFSSEGSPQSSIPVPQNENRFLTNFVLLTYEDKEYIGVQYNTDEWDLFDPLTGESRPAPGIPELYVTTMPEKSISISVVPDADGGNLEYQLLDLNGNPVGVPVDIGTSYEGHIGLSPDGSAAAFVGYDDKEHKHDSAVTIWNNGEVRARVEVNPLGFSFLWGPLAWRIKKRS
jgi:hypothetical protein